MARVAQHWVFLAAFLPAQRPWTTLQRHTFCLTSDAGRLPARTGTVPCPTFCFGIDFDLSQILTPWQFGTLWSVPNYFSWILLAWKVSLVPLKLQPILGGSAAPRTLSTEAHYQKAGAFVVHHIFFILLRNVPAHLSFILSIFLGSTHTHTHPFLVCLSTEVNLREVSRWITLVFSFILRATFLFISEKNF